MAINGFVVFVLPPKLLGAVMMLANSLQNSRPFPFPNLHFTLSRRIHIFHISTYSGESTYSDWTNTVGFSFERVGPLVSTRLASRSNALGFLFERVWLFVQTRLAFHRNAFGFSLERVSYNDRTRPCRLWANAIKRKANAFGQKQVTPCVWRVLYDDPALIDLIQPR